MPHNYIFGRELSHPVVVENQFEGDLGGHSNAAHNIIGMKRKESWSDLQAGNFEMQKEFVGGPTSEKRMKTSSKENPQIDESPNGLENAAQFCQSMADEMAISCSNGSQSVVNDALLTEEPCDVEMDCGTPDIDNDALQQKAHEPSIDDTWYGYVCLYQTNGNWWEEIVGCCHGC